jgi:DNA replication initiation complex subunit (GINS family)
MTEKSKEETQYQTIHSYHKGILSAIDDIQTNTSKVLLSQEMEIINYFNERINKIKQEFQEERIQRNKKYPYPLNAIKSPKRPRIFSQRRTPQRRTR